MNFNFIGTKKFYQQIGTKLKEFRVSKGYTQEYIANKVNISQNHYGKIEKGVNYPSLSTLAKICNILNCDLNYVVFDEISTNYNFEDISSLNKNDQDTIKEIVNILIKRLKKGEDYASNTVM